ncbi:MAG: sulfatase-like hydrolase/transferase [Gammaproteobacteria bacterium]|nr:sulfatase-like hydrolase/transferase [Gammaproteobacteria bacterium]
MKRQLSRRDILKLGSMIPAAYYLPRTSYLPAQNGPAENFIIILFDSWTAYNTSLYNYPRDTTPNISRLSQKAIVYHNHFSAGHFTYPSTASLLTSVLPWTHKGHYSDEGKRIIEEFHTKNIYTLFDTHHRFTYTNNLLANSILLDMESVIGFHHQPHELSISDNLWYDKLFVADSDTAILSWTRAMRSLEDGYANTVFLSKIYEFFKNRYDEKLSQTYPRGIPEQSGKLSFLLEEAIDWTSKQIRQHPQPFLGYVHLLPPHDPYNTRLDFYNIFKDDGFVPIKKPFHPLATEGLTFEDQLIHRQEYDEYVAFVDSEFGRLMEDLEKSNALENTWVILTSDHGEMFERGIPNHATPSFHRPLIHIPLLIFPPGQKERIDIYSNTSTIDLLPTLLHLNHKPFPDWLEGQVIPPFNPNLKEDRPIYSLDGRYNNQFGTYKNGTIMLLKNAYKLTYMFGDKKSYQHLNGQPLFELFNLEQDPEEMENLYHPEDKISKELFEEMTTKMVEKEILEG